MGGGPAGASTAFFLSAIGLRVALIDRATFPREKPCAEYLSPQASRILAAFSLEDRIQNAGASRLRGMIVRAPSGESLRGDFEGAHQYRGFRDRGLAIRRSLLDTMVLRRAQEAGVAVHEGVRVTNILRDDIGLACGVTALDSRGEIMRVNARLVVGADGLNSTVAKRAHLSRRKRWPSRVAIVSHYENVLDVGEYGEMHVDRDGYLGIAPVDSGVVNVALVIPRNRARAIGGNPAAYLRAWIENRHHLRSRFSAAQPVGAATATGPFNRVSTGAWRKGVALVGDAVDFFDPFTGEGIYTALRSGEMLAQYIAAHFASPAAGDAPTQYEAALQREFADKRRVERLVGFTIAFPSLINRAVHVLAKRKDMADLLVGVTGDFVPANVVLRPGYFLGFLVP